MAGTISYLLPDTFTMAAEQCRHPERHGGCRGKGHTTNPVLPVPSSLSTAHGVRLLQTSQGLSLGPQGQLGPLHRAKSR